MIESDDASPGSLSVLPRDVFSDLNTSHSGSGFINVVTEGTEGLPAMFHIVGSSFSDGFSSERAESCVLDRRMPLAARVTPVRTRLSSALSSGPMRGRSSFGARRASSVMDGTEGMREARVVVSLVPTPMLPSRRCIALRALVTRESIAARSSPRENALPFVPSGLPEPPIDGSEAISERRDLPPDTQQSAAEESNKRTRFHASGLVRGRGEAPTRPEWSVTDPRPRREVGVERCTRRSPAPDPRAWSCGRARWGEKRI